MNRIEEIKGRIENYKSEYLPLFNNNGEMQEWNDMFGDVQYLMYKLEIAEKALNDVLTEFGYNHIEPSERLQEIEYIVQDGIKQIRE